MVALRGAEADRALKAASSDFSAVLVFGPDAGLVAERCDAFVAARLGMPPDPFGLVRLEGDEIASDPERLLDEAHTVPLFGGARVIRLRAGSRAIHGAVEKLLTGPRPEAGIVIEAGDLKKSHPLRSLVEKARNAALIACYADGAGDLARLIDGELGALGLSIAPDARAALVQLLGADRLASRQEVQKLALYAHGQGRVDHDAVEAVVADASASAADKAIDAAFSGDAARLDAALAAALAAGVSPQSLLSTALRQALQLARMKITGDERGMFSMPPQRKAATEEALRRWSAPALETAVQRLAEATLAARRQSDLAGAIASRALLGVAAGGGRGR